MSFTIMDYYCERGGYEHALKFAEEALNGRMLLWGDYYLEITAENADRIFETKFEGVDSRLKQEYLYSLDALSYILNAYTLTGDNKYKDFVDKIIKQYFKFSLNNNVVDLDVEPELSIYAHVLLISKYYGMFKSSQDEENIKIAFEKYGEWLSDEKNFIIQNNHGLFQILALLHLSVLWEEHPDSKKWVDYAVEKINEIVEVAYYPDGTNNENSTNYFVYNNYLYSQIIIFCEHYNISGIDNVKTIIKKAEENIIVFAHKDNSIPIIGDGNSNFTDSNNKISKYFPDLGVCVVKVGDIYVTFKIKTVWQAHAHIDISSITIRYKDTDLVCDSGKQNYDKFSPVSRFERSSSGHSAILPTKVDALFLGDVEEQFQDMKITKFDVKEDYAKAIGEYTYAGTKVIRDIEVRNGQVVVRDSWKGNEPVNMRQRFVLPTEFIDRCSFSISNRLARINLDDKIIEYKIFCNMDNCYTIPNFGVYSKKYGEYETTLFVDTICENSKFGSIEARIVVEDV